MSGATYTLKVPIEAVTKGADGEQRKTITELTVRRALARDLLVTDQAKGEVGKALALLSRLTGVDQKTLGGLDSEDFEALASLVGDFMGAPKVAG